MIFDFTYADCWFSDAVADIIMCAFVVFTNGKNGTIGRQILFKVLPMVPLVMPLLPMAGIYLGCAMC